MASNSESTYGARLNNAEKLATALTGFGNYVAQKPELSIATFSAMVTGLKTQNTGVATKKLNYSLAVENRRQVFEKSDLSIGKLLSPINSTAKVIFGKTSVQAIGVAGIIVKIRGTKKKPKTGSTPTEEGVSQSYGSYGSQTQFFSDLITNLTTFGTAYAPTNTNITVAKLNVLLTSATAANNLVMDAYTKFRQTNDIRIHMYDAFSQIANRIKDSVKAQYGSQSIEYKLVKGLKI